MSVFKCKMCGGDLNITDGQTVAECEYCGSKQTVAGGDNEKKVNLFNRANRLRISCEFDKAAGIYENIISEFPEEAEAYWGLCLCNYGIEYVDDPATANKVPTCHRASFKKLRKDANYEMALENADMNARIIYEEQAKEIDRIMGEILALSKDEDPYDIFICYKESDNSGVRTPDSVLAQDIYDSLTQKGYRVFFSRITLEDKLGVHYEPYIFSALNSAKMMLVVGTDYEYMNAVWVRNEWSRFLRLMAEDKTKVLVPCYQNMDPYDMPDQFAGLQSQDCSKLGFMQDLIRGIDKIFGKNEPKPVKKETVIINNPVSNPSVSPLLERISIFLEDEKWNDANIYCEKVLDIDPKNAEAYLGKLMAELQVKTRKSLADCAEPFDNKDNYAKVIRFGDETLENEIRGYIKQINDRNETARKQGIYNDGKAQMSIAKTESDFKSAASAFGSIAGFKDADEQKRNCLEKAEITRKEAEFNKKNESYENALNIMKNAVTEEQFMKAASEFEWLLDFKDSEKMKEECLEKAQEIKTKRLEWLSNQNEFELYKKLMEVERHLRKLKVEYYNMIFQHSSKGKSLNDEINIQSKTLNELLNQDKVKISNIVSTNSKFSITTQLKTIPLGNIAVFGKYKNEDIPWRIIERNGNKCLLISVYPLEVISSEQIKNWSESFLISLTKTDCNVSIPDFRQDSFKALADNFNLGLAVSKNNGENAILSWSAYINNLQFSYQDGYYTGYVKSTVWIRPIVIVEF